LTEDLSPFSNTGYDSFMFTFKHCFGCIHHFWYIAVAFWFGLKHSLISVVSI
jgi:hypothetical protein